MSKVQQKPASLLTDKLKGLYAITDAQLINEAEFERAVKSALEGGTSIIQYRDKSGNQEKRFRQADLLRLLCEQYQALLIINDDIELAKAVGAHGVHLGKNDTSISSARKHLGNNAIIGISCYNDIELAVSAEKNSASYVAFGAMFSSPTKPDAINAELNIISTAKQRLSIPVCAIGGITETNIEKLIQQGVDMAAVISSLFAANNIQHTANILSQHFR